MLSFALPIKIEDPKKIDVNLLFEKFYTGDNQEVLAVQV